MGIDRFHKCIGFLSSILGITQGLVWFILALIAVLIYSDAWIPTFDKEDKYGSLLSIVIIECFLRGDGLETVHIGPIQIFACSIVYLIISLIWITLSSFQFWVLFREKPLLLKKAFVPWAVCTIIVSIYDLVWTCLLARDYAKVAEQANLTKNPSIVEYTIVLAYGVMMTLIARGFVLWIVNVTVAVFNLKLAFSAPEEVSKRDVNSNNIIRAFNTNLESSKPELHRSNSFTSSRSFGTFRGIPRLAPVQSTNETLARLSTHVGDRSPSNFPPSRPGSALLYPASPLSPGFSHSVPQTPSSRPAPPLKPVLKNRFQSPYG